MVSVIAISLIIWYSHELSLVSFGNRIYGTGSYNNSLNAHIIS